MSPRDRIAWWLLGVPDRWFTVIAWAAAIGFWVVAFLVGMLVGMEVRHG
jgi:hypothetical protein